MTFSDYPDMPGLTGRSSITETVSYPFPGAAGEAEPISIGMNSFLMGERSGQHARRYEFGLPV